MILEISRISGLQCYAFDCDVAFYVALSRPFFVIITQLLQEVFLKPSSKNLAAKVSKMPKAIVFLSIFEKHACIALQHAVAGKLKQPEQNYSRICYRWK